MWLGNTHIITPAECKALFNKAWRHEVAKYLNDTKADSRELPGSVRRDPHMRDQLRYLATSGDEPASKRQIFDFVNAIFDRTVNQVRCRLEALLLSHASLEAISSDLDLKEELVSLYEKLFFNVRGDDGRMAISIGTRSNIALNGMLEADPTLSIEGFWSLCAVRYGAGALMRIWGWPHSACEREDHTEVSIDSMLGPSLASSLLKSIVTGMLGDKFRVDMFAAMKGNDVKMEEARIKWEEVKLQIAKAGLEEKKKDATGQIGLVQDMLEGFQPKRIAVQYSEGDRAIIDKKLAEKAKGSATKSSSQLSKLSRDQAMAGLDAELQVRINEQK